MSTLFWAIPGIAMGVAAVGVLRCRGLRRTSVDAPPPPVIAVKAERPPRPISPRPRNYQAVSIVLCASACDAAQRLTGKRFLWKETPRLPLAGCDRAACKCAFAVHRDRRSEQDRRGGFAAYGDFHSDLTDARRSSGPNRRRP